MEVVAIICGHAHVDLASNIDESHYKIEILSADLTIQHPPSNSNERFDHKTAVYAQWYPNIMLYQYGPWLDIHLVVPIKESNCIVCKSWFIEKRLKCLPKHTYK